MIYYVLRVKKSFSINFFWIILQLNRAGVLGLHEFCVQGSSRILEPVIKFNLCGSSTYAEILELA